MAWLARAGRAITPFILFGTLYVATFLLLRFLGLPWYQWIGLASVVAATAVTIAIREHGRWDVGLGGPPQRALGHLFAGALGAVLLIGVADLALLLIAPSTRAFSGGFPWMELATVFVPAAVHEELLFRGYLYQKLRSRQRALAILLTSVVFAALHANNQGISSLAMLNLFLGGVLLALAYEWRRTLWMPIGLHLAWNLMSGPVLGHAVSGYSADASVFRTTVSGDVVLTGGAFGLEGSLCITATEILAIALLARLNRRPT